jgi:hypothetical protein
VSGSASPSESRRKPRILVTFDQDNPEMLIKINNACVAPFDAFWVFGAPLTNVGYVLSVKDLKRSGDLGSCM